MENQSTYRIRTKLGETEPINIPVSLMQEYDSFEILSLNINTDDTYRSYTSTEGIVIGRVSTANNGLGIPNVRVSIFVPKGAYNQSDEEAVLYPFSAPTDMDGDRVRYNLLPSDSDVDCYQVIGTLPTKRKILDNETICEVFEKYYKYTTVTNEAGDFMLSNIPVGKQRIHIDADLSDIGPFLSQKPYNMIENLGFEKNRFESTRQFKTSKDLDSLAQVITQNKSVYVYPYWGDSAEKSSEMKITRTDLSLNYEFKTGAVFMGSVITDKQSNSIRQNCTATENAGKMSDMVTGPGRIEMIRKTIDNKIEQYRIKGDMLINDNGVWCYMIPMNLDYVRTDEFGNIVPTDDPNKGVPTRARVRFRISLNQMESDEDAHKRCSYLVPNNPKYDDVKFLKENDADYSFGSDTWDESFVDLFWNQVYTVKNYVPRIQKTVRPTNRKHTGIKMVNHFGDNNPFPYNGLTIKLPFLYRLICVIVHIFIYLIYFINLIISIIGALPCWLAGIKIWKWRPFKFALKIIPPCIELSSEFCDDGINKNVTYPGCSGCVWTDKTKPECDAEQYGISQQGGEAAVCTNNDTELFNCVENQLAQQNEATSFNFTNDWINGCLYMPLWYRKIRPKKSFFFGLFKRRAKDQWCAGEKNEGGRQLKMASFCSHGNTKSAEETQNYEGEKFSHHITKFSDNCGNECHKIINWVKLSNGVIINRENMLGQKVWYYKAVEVTTSLDASFANEYENYDLQPMISKTLYATDIVLLGSMNDCDLNGIPKFFNYLKGSTYNMPTDILFTDTEIEYKFDENGNLLEQDSHKISVSAGCDWGNSNEYGYNDGGLFYSIGCSSIKVDTESCINLRRICELGVGQDEMQYVENIDENNVTGIGGVSINNETDELEYNELDYYLRPDGYISYDDIIDFNYRSMFATMNGNRLKTKINTTNGVREYDFRHLYIDNFDGSLNELMKDEQKNRNAANYRYNYLLETTNNDYLTFRMSDRPFYYDGSSLVQKDKNEGPGAFTLPKYQNSFYFYFGLKEGKTAIDLFNEQYNGPCSTKNEKQESIPYEKKANGWCSIDSDDNGTYDHKTYDGYLKIDLEQLPLPCNIILNSKENNAVTYTITTENGNTNVTDEKICFYGSYTENVDREMKGYTRYYLRYENPSYGEAIDVQPCYMLNNGDYNMYVTDGEGNQHGFVISIRGEYLQFDNVERKFAQPNNVLLKYYKTVGAKGSTIPYHSVAKSPDPIVPDESDEITIVPDESGVPFVTRNDKAMTYVEKNAVLSGGERGYVKLNGTICLYNLFFDNQDLDKFIIEVEPYDTKKEGGKDVYIDEDFWNGSSDKTWYKKKMITDYDAGIICKDCTTVDNGNKVKVTPGGNTKYFYYNVMDAGNGLKVKCYVIKCPKGDVNYRVRVTQLCFKNGAYYKSNNYIERKIFVSQPTPYKLLINDADYDIIKNFKTGWELRDKEALQLTKDGLEGKNGYRPFKGIGDITQIKGWLEFSDINNNYDWDEDPDKYGKTAVKFEKCTDDDKEKYGYENIGLYKLQAALKIKENAKPKEPQRFNYDDDSKYNEDYNKWLQDTDKWENGYLNVDGTRAEGYDKWENISKEEYLGGCCGYTYVKKDAQILLNRLEFANKMKVSFWIQCENSEKTVSYSVRTDDNPYDVWSVYNPEYESIVNTDYNETDSDNEKRDTVRHYWKCVGESTRYISNIKIPNITSYNSEDFGIAEDNVRIMGYKTTYNEGKMTLSDGVTTIPAKSICFGQDNIAENSKDDGSISIKPPYLVACVNYEGITKPNDLKKVYFFDKGTNSYGLEPYQFGETGNNKKYIKDGQYEFFQYYLIDKIFAPDIICWSYINNVPYYLPWFDYDCPQNDYTRLGYLVKTEGILSGVINNGITNDGGNDFDSSNIFDKETPVITYIDCNEDSIPTKRCIMYGDKSDYDDKGITEFTDLIYKNYVHSTKVQYFEKGNVCVDDKTGYIPNQYRVVPNREGELEFIDYGGNCETTRTLYGSMKVTLNSSTLNTYETFTQGVLGFIFSSNGENGDTSLTLKVSCANSDTDRPILYYIFQASQKKRNGSMLSSGDGTDKKCWYPINSFSVKTVDESGNSLERPKYNIDCKCRDGEVETDWTWDGSTKKAPHFFNKNTTEKRFKDKVDYEDDLAYEIAKSNIEWEDSEGEIQYTATSGYGNTGVFEKLKHLPYFVVAITENNCRAVSPVYDFHIVYYISGLLELGGQYILRTALVYVLRGYKECETEGDGYDGKTIKKGWDGYCKTPRNYYLTQFDFTISYTIANGNVLITNDGVVYEKENSRFMSKEEYEENGKVGDSYVEEVEGETGKTTYVVHTKTGGSMENVGEETKEKPSGTELKYGEGYTYYYECEAEKDREIVTCYQIVTVDEEGNIVNGDKKYDKEDVKGYTKIDPEGDYYTSYTVEEQDVDEEGNPKVDAEGNPIMVEVTYYKSMKYSTESVETLNYDPRVPYFIRYNDKTLSKDEYEALEPIFKTKKVELVEKISSFYVVDVVGLKHKCKLHQVINDNDTWKYATEIPKEHKGKDDSTYTKCVTNEIYYTSDSQIDDSKFTDPEVAYHKFENGEGTIYFKDSVEDINEGAFEGNTNLTSIELPPSVEEIGNNGFKGCSSLTEIELPEGVTQIGESGFEGCSALTDISLPDSEYFTTISNSTFKGCTSLGNVNIPNTVKEIGESAFEGCSTMTNADIPEGVKTLGESAYKDCTGLKCASIPSTITVIEKNTFQNCTSLINVNLDEGLTDIKSNAFENCISLKSLIIPNSVINVDKSAFSGCTGLNSVTIGSGLTVIDKSVFSGCTNVQTLTYCNGCGSAIKTYLTSASKVEIPNTVTSIEENAFKDFTNLKNITIPNSIESLGNNIFQGCSGVTIQFKGKREEWDTLTGGKDTWDGSSDGCEVICKDDAFITLKAKGDGKLLINDTVETKFKSTSTSVRVTPKLTNVTAKSQTNLVSMTIPDKLNKISENAFNGCNGLTSITLPSSINSIGDNAFNGCTSLKEIYFNGSETQWNDITKGSGWNTGVPEDCKIRYNG